MLRETPDRFIEPADPLSMTAHALKGGAPIRVILHVDGNGQVVHVDHEPASFSIHRAQLPRHARRLIDCSLEFLDAVGRARAETIGASRQFEQTIEAIQDLRPLIAIANHGEAQPLKEAS